MIFEQQQIQLNNAHHRKNEKHNVNNKREDKNKENEAKFETKKGIRSFGGTTDDCRCTRRLAYFKV
jgi:hypothetical protein